jgi:hypothetical protein
MSPLRIKTDGMNHGDTEAQGNHGDHYRCAKQVQTKKIQRNLWFAVFIPGFFDTIT